jgi:hypothetical protein
MNQTQRTLQEYRTTLPPADVIARAKDFFTRHVKIYAAFLEREGPGYVGFRGQGNEELFIGAVEKDGATLVTGTTYLYDMHVARFFTTLPPFVLSEQMLPPGPAAEQAPDRPVTA